MALLSTKEILWRRSKLCRCSKNCIDPRRPNTPANLLITLPTLYYHYVTLDMTIDADLYCNNWLINMPRVH